MSNAAGDLSKALRKTLAAVEGLGHKAAAIGAVAHQAWGLKRETAGAELLISLGPDRRESVLSAARGEGLRQSPDNPLRLVYGDAAATVDLVEASTPFHAQVIARAQRANVLSTTMPLATCEDLILLAADRGVMIELLRGHAGRIDGAYLKREAEAAGVFDQVKLAWQEAKRQG